MVEIIHFIMSSQGAQYTYMGMAIANALLVFDIYLLRWLAAPPRNIVIEDNVVLFTMAHVFKACAFLLSIYVTGAHPRYTAAALAPWIRLTWFFVLIFLAPSIASATYKIFRAMWANAHRSIADG